MTLEDVQKEIVTHRNELAKVDLIKDKAEELWTDEVKTAWATFQPELEAKMNPESE